MPQTVTQGGPPQPVEPSGPLGRGVVRRRAPVGDAVAPSSPRVVGRKSKAATGVATAPSVGLVPGRGVKRRIGYPAAVNPEGFGGIAQVLIPDGVFLAAEAREERWPYGRVLLDWTAQDFTGPLADLSQNVESIVVERSRVGELPETAGLVDGYDSATGKVVVSGRRPGTDPSAITVAGELSPYRTDRPRYGHDDVTSPAIIDMGLITEDGPRHYRQFSGPLRTIGINESTETAQLSLVDRNEDFRELITLPTYGEFANHAARRAWAFTVNTAGLVDLIARACGIFASPRPRADAIISCTGHGILAAERGFNGAPISIDTTQKPKPGLWTDDQHPWGMLGSPEPVASGLLQGAGYQELYGTASDGFTPPLKLQSGYSCGVSGWLHAGSYMGSGTAESRLWHVRPTVNDNPRLFVNVLANGQIYAGIVQTDGTIVGTPKVQLGSSKWNHLGVFWRWTSNTALEVTIRTCAPGKVGTTLVYALTHSAVTVTPTPFYDGYKASLQLRAFFSRSWTNLQLWVNSAVPTVAQWQALENHTSQARIARGINELLYLPDVAAKDAWELLKAVVAAEYGVHGFDQAGVYFFRPRADAYAGDVDVDIDVATNLSEVAYSVSSDSVRNVVGYSVTPQYHDTLGKGPSRCSAVVTAQDILQFVVPAGKKYTYEVDWPFGAAGWQGGVLPYCYQEQASTASRDAGNGFAKWSGDIQHGWTYATKGASGGWTIYDNVQSVVVRYAQTSARRALIIVDNSDSTCTKDVRISTATTPDAPEGGEPALRIGGWPLKAQAAHVASFRNQDSIDRHRGQARGLDLPDSEWRQMAGVLDPVCKALLAAMADAIPVLEDLPVRGNPRTQVGMIARCTFRGEASQPVVGTIVKTSRTLDKSGLTDRISVRPLPKQTLAPPGWLFFIDISRYQGDRTDPLDLLRCYQLGYMGCIAKIGQGAGTTMAGATYAASIDSWWTTWRDQGRTLWPSTFAGYWYLGNTEAPADQAARCKAAIGDLSIPVMMDWEDAGGNFANLQACVTAFKNAGLKVTLLYANRGYTQNASGGGNPTNLDSLGLNIVHARYWTNDQGNPRALFDDITDPTTFLLGAFNGGTPDMAQFTQYGVVYSGMAIDVNAAPVSTLAQLSALFYNR